MEQYFDPQTGRPLPTPRWWVGTSHLRTESQWYHHLKSWRDWSATMCLTLAGLGVILFVTWPAPGFGQGIAIILWLFSLLMSPLYVMYSWDLDRYFPDGRPR